MKKLKLIQWTTASITRLAAFALLLVVTATASAQSVTITPESGNLICALTRATESGYATGGSAVWRHNQLGLTMICSDRKTYSPEGIVTDLGNNLFEMNSTTFQLVGGMMFQSYVQIFLPKGYRFTGYKIDVQNNIPENYNGNSGWCSHAKPYYFGETDATHNFTDALPYVSLGTEISDKTFRLERTSTGISDMGRVLSFKLATDLTDESSALYMAVSLTNITVTYTTEEPDQVGTLAEFDERITDGVSCTTIPFYTGRVDLGVVKSRVKETTTTGYEGQTNRLSFMQSEESDIYGDLIFYEEDCVDTSLPVEERDTMTLEGKQSITTKRYNNQYYYSLAYGEEGTTYYMETPYTKALSYDMDEDGKNDTIVQQGLRYRITGGTIYYGGKYGETEVVQIVDTLNGTQYYAYATDDGEVKYTTTPTYWYHKGTGKLYSDSPNGTRYYLTVTKVEGAASSKRFRENGEMYIQSTTAYEYYPALTTDRTLATRFEIASAQSRITFESVDTTSIYKISGSFPDYEYTYVRSYNEDPVTQYLDLARYQTVRGSDWITGYRFLTTPSGNYCWAEVSYLQDEQDLAPYTLIIYDKNGKKELARIDVASGAAPASYDLPKGTELNRDGEFNNDAIKIRIEPQTSDNAASEDLDYEALVYISPIIEAISPYIDIMSCVLRSKDDTTKDFVEATYNAEDFAIGGGSVTMPIPSSLVGKPLKMTFENLHTKMTDNTYWNGEYHKHGRNAFVMSSYYKLFGDENGYNNNIYNHPEYAMQEDENNSLYDYTQKVYVDVIGNLPFKFNNAYDISDVAQTEAEWKPNVFHEYPFSVEAYHQTTGVDSLGNTIYGKFAEKVFTFKEDDYYTDTVYVFTSDEPRYNISPTGAIKHRFYAYYKMAVTFQQKLYDPIIVFDTIYNKTFYSEEMKELPMYGITFYAWADEAHTEPGYLTDVQAYNSLVPYLVDSIKYPDLVSGEQILYIDYSNLKGLITTQENSWSYLQIYASPNCLAFLPAYNDWQADNFARKDSKTSGVYFTSTGNIVIKDRYPFFSPYHIQIPSENYVKYERIVSNKTKNKQPKKATIALPFRMLLKDKLYSSDTNLDPSGTQFTVWTMEAKDKVGETSKEVGFDYTQYVNFVQLGKEGDVDTLYANRPYFIQLTDDYYEKVQEGTVVPDSVCFVIVQRGTVIAPSRIPNDNTKNIPDYDDESTYTWHRGLTSMPYWTSTGSLNGADIKFTAQASYSGVKQEKCFYYGNEKFYCSENLRGDDKTAKCYPFRGFITYEGTSAAKYFIPRFVDDESTTGIGEVQDAKGYSVYGGQGEIAIAAFSDVNVNIYTIGGAAVAKVQLSSGQTKAVPVAAGVYIVGGKKVVVR